MIVNPYFTVEVSISTFYYHFVHNMVA